MKNVKDIWYSIPCNIFDYDETNMKDNPTKKNCIFCHGLCCVEEKKEHAKQAFSVMFCGS